MFIVIPSLEGWPTRTKETLSPQSISKNFKTSIFWQYYPGQIIVSSLTSCGKDRQNFLSASLKRPFACNSKGQGHIWRQIMMTKGLDMIEACIEVVNVE